MDCLGPTLWKVSLKILNSGFILKTFTHVVTAKEQPLKSSMRAFTVRIKLGKA